MWVKERLLPSNTEYLKVDRSVYHPSINWGHGWSELRKVTQVYNREETHLSGFCPVLVLHLQLSNSLLILQATLEQGMEWGSAAGTGCQAEAAGAGTTLRMETAQRAEGTGSSLPSLSIFCAIFLIRDTGTAHSLLPFHLCKPHRFAPGLNYQVITTLYPTPYRAQVA